MIYLDNHATTPCDPAVLEAMLPYFTEQFANPASATHKAGKDVAKAVENARLQIANLINSDSKEIVFTSGATESNNLAIQGLAYYPGTTRKKIVTTEIEHKAVLAPGQFLKNHGFEFVVLPVDPLGRVIKEAAEKAIDENTLVVSVQTANNEIGTIQDIPYFSNLAHEHGAFFHTDAAQAVGKIPIDVTALDVDLLSISGHKLYGPKGIGALYIRGGPRSLPITPLVFGGGQENEIRPGTLNVPGIVGLGRACELCQARIPEESSGIGELRDELEANLLSSYDSSHSNGDVANRLPGNISLTFPGIDAEALIANVPELSISTGSACTSGAPSPSHVLLAIGLDRMEANQTVRIGIGRFNSRNDILRASQLIEAAINRILSLK